MRLLSHIALLVIGILVGLSIQTRIQSSEHEASHSSTTAPLNQEPENKPSADSPNGITAEQVLHSFNSPAQIKQFDAAEDASILRLNEMLGGAIANEAKTRTEASLKRLRVELDLTAAQVQSIQASTTSYLSEHDSLLPLDLLRHDSPLRGAIEQTLSAHQLIQYTELRTQHRYNWIEAQANVELAELQQTNRLTEAEKDDLFSQLVEKYTVQSQ
ncbi:hypothetical protein [Coraliomargarita akajimensis]|uniref:Uncharacterized protein n=1 Tax=Coraliomargarita akajimensis (strain DSM 45221 / IAM 15411 / JCM 23193 / KCTC 12865 / 04OKA010-24) TaxID=583355 RepID=D5EKI4_CORAD|nr:hypothetical protein [Coraliomargarita akajimensis]ADE53065.1 hypothetical protein Caka_0036 [Coraliomargarita akajimensis DSM 45221]